MIASHTHTQTTHFTYVKGVYYRHGSSFPLLFECDFSDHLFVISECYFGNYIHELDFVKFLWRNIYGIRIVLSIR